MELELGLKITKTRDDIASISKYQLVKDKGPVFQSRETNTMFILTAHLKGYKRNGIGIKISEDGSKISIRGEKSIQEMVMMGWVMHRKMVGVVGFNKVFKIPNGVNLDRINAKYDEDEWILSILMPKLVKGICGARFEEFREEEFDKGISELEKSETDHVSSSVGETSQKGSKESEVQDIMEKKEGDIDDKMVDDANKEMNEERIEKEVGESKFETEDRLKENMNESSMEPFEEMKGSEELDQNVVDHIPSNIGDISQKELKESRIQQMEKTLSTKGKMDGGESEKEPVETNKNDQKSIFGDTIQKDITKAKIETENEDQECVGEKACKEGSDAMVAVREEFPKNLPKTTLEESGGLNVQKMQEIKDVKEVKEEMIKRKGKEIEYFVEKGEGERLKIIHMEAKKGITGEKMQEGSEKRKNGIEESGQQHVGENTIKGGFEVPKSVTEELPKQLEEVDGSIGFKVAKEEEQKEVIKKALAETEILMEKVERKESKKRNETLQKKTEESNIGERPSDGPHVQEKLPNQVVEEIAQDEKDKNEYGIVKLKEEGSIKMHVEPDEAFENDRTGQRIEKEIRKQKLEPSDQLSGKESVDYGRKREQFPEMEEAEEGANIEANEDFKKEVIKETTGKEIEDSKIQTKEKDEHDLQEEMSKEICQARKAAKEDFPMKMLDSPADTREGLKDTAQKGKEVSKIITIVKDQQCLQEEMSKGRDEENTAARQFPMEIVDSLAKTKEGPKGNEIGEEELEVKRKNEETKVVDSTTKEKIQGSKSERITQILHEEHEKKHPKALEIENPERELQSAKDPTTCSKVVNLGFKEIEQGSAKDKKQKTKLLPPKIQSKETHESKDETMKQDILKPKKTKHVGEQCIYNTASTEEVATIGDQVVNPLSEPRFSSTQQSEVEEKEKLYAKYEASLESHKEDPTKDVQNLIQMKENQEDKQKEILKPEIPQEKHLMKEEQVIRKGEFHQGKNVGETMKEKTEGPKKRIDDRDQNYVARDVGKVETTEEEMSKKFEVNSGSIAERLETKRGLKNTPEREEHITTPNVNDEKPKIIDEIIKADNEKVEKAKCIPESMKTTQEKDNAIKSEVVELEKPIMQWKFPKTKEHVALTEPRYKEKHHHGTKEIKTPKIAAYEGVKPSKLQNPTITQQSTDEENRKSENVVEEHGATKESPKMNIVETEQIDSLQPQVLENDFFDEQKVNELEEALEQCEFQSSKMQENNDKKEYQTPKAVEEGIFLKKREGSKVAKSEETKDSSREKSTQTAEENKPKIKEITPQFEKASGSKQVAEKMHQRESEVTPKMGVESTTKIEEITNKGVERKDPHEFTWPTMDCEIPKIKEVQQKKERERQIHAPVATVSKEEAYSKSKGEIDKPQINQFPSPSMEMLSKEPHESEEYNMKEDDTEAESLVQVRERKEPIDEQEEELDQCGFQGPKILIENSGQQHVQENNDEKGYQTPKEIEEKLLKQKHNAEIVLKKREGPKVAKSEEAKDGSRLKRERGKTTQTEEEKKPKMKEKASGFKGVAEKMHETREREHQRESEEVISKMRVEPPTTIEKTPNKEVERKEPHELAWPNMDNEIPKIKEVQQATTTHSKTPPNNVEGKGEIDKPPSIQMVNKESHELDELSMKEDDSNSKGERKKQPIHSTKGTIESEAVADKVAQQSKPSSSSCTQQFEADAEDKTAPNQNEESQKAKKKHSKIHVQESNKSKTGQEVEQIETLQQESLADQQCINKDKEEKHGIEENEEEKGYEEVLEEASEEKKDDTTISKKLFLPLVIAGSAFLVSIMVFVWHKRAKKK